MPSVFVSYSRKDVDFVAQLTHDLELRQAKVWWDRRLAPGEKFVDMILRQVAEADYILAVHSEHSGSSKWVALEMGAVLAGASNKPGVLQLLRIDVSDLPQWIADRNAVLMDDANYHEGLRTLCDAIDIHYEIDEKGTDSGRRDEHLKVFRAGEQWMELLRGQHGLECILVNAREQKARVQWTMTPEDVRAALDDPNGIRVRAPSDGFRPWGTFDIGRLRSWRWSPQLMEAEGSEAARVKFEEVLRTFLQT
jgi:hypothetical protein